MKTFVRHQDWEERLSLYLDRVAEEPFKWGSHDCALFAANCVRVMTGDDPVEDFRDVYDTATGAALALREHGDGTLLKTMKSIFGEPISPHFAQRGDVMMFDRTTTGICVGRFSYFVGRQQGQEGLLTMPTSACRYAFRVPFEVAA
ncbi:DUF6950 family protein [Sphingomonas sp. Leaf242]|uniref:DUF6950 family protein n=1 Tax=Sphingomonas sp. Leaf242 TaxID=1736304 RepID=UPI0007160460|nr:hypothetical protein [Sphingomonas sp. Leaf242]KQO06899.1 hypothetical protein ASF09_11605 [Sphingomonas sp. Leaf242]